MDSEAVNRRELSAQKPLSPWLGVVASFMIPGAGPFLAGKRRRGMLWFLSTPLVLLFASWLLASPSIPGIIPGIFFIVVYKFAVWIDGYRHPKRGQKMQWLGIALLFVTFEILAQAFPQRFLSLFPARAFTVPTNGMTPTIKGKQKLQNGMTTVEDHILVERWRYWFQNPQRGDLMVFDTVKLPVPHPGDHYVKRVVGLPGDTISITNGQVWISGAALTQPAVFQKIKYVILPGCQILKNEGDTFKVPQDEYFVLGDNSPHSADSRFWGTVPRSAVIGKVTKIYWPWDRTGVPK